MRLWLIVFILLICFSLKTKSQNLIKNPSFEFFLNLNQPSFYGKFWVLNPNYTQIVNDWITFNSPDHFDSAFIPGGYNVPFAYFGNTYAKHGNAYAGISVYQGNPSDYKEYVYQQLVTPLKADSIYCLGFHVTLADRVQIAIKNLGAFFSVNTPSLVTNYDINATPQVVNNSGFITDTIGWTEIQGCFTAQGGEQYITIGSFGDRASTDTVNTISSNPLTGPGSSFSYYYIDSVSLWQNNFPTFIKEDLKSEIVSVYPNPAKDVLNFNVASVTESKKLKVEVTDVIGREILVSEYKEQLDISQLEIGIYFVSILQGDKTLVTKKVVKQ